MHNILPIIHAFLSIIIYLIFAERISKFLHFYRNDNVFFDNVYLPPFIYIPFRQLCIWDQNNLNEFLENTHPKLIL